MLPVTPEVVRDSVSHYITEVQDTDKVLEHEPEIVEDSPRFHITAELLPSVHLEKETITEISNHVFTPIGVHRKEPEQSCSPGLHNSQIADPRIDRLLLQRGK